LMLSLEDELFALEAKGVQMLARVVWRMLPPRATFLLMRVLQYRQTRRAEAARRRLQSHERDRERTLALSGTLE
jgi:hypothetical protein